MNDDQRLVILIATLRHMATTKGAKTPEAKAVIEWAKDILRLVEVPIEPLPMPPGLK